MEDKETREQRIKRQYDALNNVPEDVKEATQYKFNHYPYENMEPKQLITQDEKEQRVLENILDKLEAIDLKDSIPVYVFENIIYVKGMLQGFISIKYKNK